MFAYFENVPGADCEDDIAGAGGLLEASLDLLKPGEEAAALYVLREVRGGDAHGVVLARGVDLSQESEVRALQLLYEVVEERGGARVGVRLKNQDGPLVAQGLHGVQQSL